MCGFLQADLAVCLNLVLPEMPRLQDWSNPTQVASSEGKLVPHVEAVRRNFLQMQKRLPMKLSYVTGS